MADLFKFASAQSPLAYLGIFFGLTLVGFAITAITLRNETKRRLEIFEFRERFILWVNGRFADHQAYMQIIADSPRIQDAMGHWGIYGTFIPPFSRGSYQDWPIILNGIPAIRQSAGDYLRSDRLAGDYVDIVDEALLRALGTLETSIKARQTELVNPIFLFREGLVYTMTLPFYVLAEFGLLTKRAYSRIVASVIVRALAFGLTIFGLFSAIVGLTVDWEPFTAKFEQFRQWSGL